MIFKSAAVNPLHLFLYTKAGLTPKSASPAIAKSNKSNCLSTKLRRLIWSWNSELNYRNSPISRCPAALSLRDFSVNRIPFDLIILVLFFSSNRASDIFELCIWLRPAACGKIPFTRYFGRDFSRYYGLLFRFLLEAKARSGQFIFDRAFWGWRHLSCRLFRVGTLEFEYRPGRFKRTASARHCSTLPCSVRIHSLGCPPFRSCAARFLRTGRALLCSARFVFV